jgi:hypothetical protein
MDETQDVAPAPKPKRGRPPKPRNKAGTSAAECDAQSAACPAKPAGRSAACPAKPAGRRRGGQPGNTNAVKTGRHGRVTMEIRALNRRLRAIRRRAEAMVDAVV